MSDNKQNKPTLSMKVFKGPQQVEREKNDTIWDRFHRLQRSLAPLRKGRHIKKGVHRIKREDETKSMVTKKKTITGKELAKLWEGNPRISNENGEDWMNLIKEILFEQKLPDNKWD